MNRRKFLAALVGTFAAATTGWLGGFTDRRTPRVAARGLRDQVGSIESFSMVDRDAGHIQAMANNLESTIFYGNPIIDDMKFHEGEIRRACAIPVSTWRKLNA